MGWRTPDVDGRDMRPGHTALVRPTVLLALHDDDVRARFAYQLTALGFDVVTHVAADLRDFCRPDVIVAELEEARAGAAATAVVSGDERLRAVPVVAVADDVTDTTRTIARRHGCAAVCLATCSTAALAAGIHAVIGG